MAAVLLILYCMICISSHSHCRLEQGRLPYPMGRDRQVPGWASGVWWCSLHCVGFKDSLLPAWCPRFSQEQQICRVEEGQWRSRTFLFLTRAPQLFNLFIYLFFSWLVHFQHGRVSPGTVFACILPELMRRSSFRSIGQMVSLPTLG